MERTTTHKLQNIIFSLDADDLKIVASMIKDRRRSLGREIKYSLNIGDTITVDDLGEGTITKINRTRCLATFDKGSYNVPFSLINQGE